MKKILFQAYNPQGQQITDYIEAASNGDALSRLEHQGFSRIQLLDDTAIALHRQELTQLSASNLRDLAKLEASFRRKPGFRTFIVGVLHINRYVIALGLGLLAWGWYRQSTGFMVSGLVVAAGVPLFAIWQYRVPHNYNRLLRAFATGQREESLQLIDWLFNHIKQADMTYDLAVRRAAVKSEQWTLAEALASLQPWEASLAASPGMYESRLASVYHGYGDIAGFLDTLRTAHAKAPGSPTMIVDLALGEARCGDVEVAASVIDSLDSGQLPLHGQPFIDWINGLIGLRRQHPEAHRHMQAAIEGFLTYLDNPAMWPSLAVCVGDYAYLSDDPHSRESLADIVAKVWPILVCQAEPAMVAALQRHYPHLQAA